CRVAWPLLRATGVPRLVAPFMNCTEPVGVPPPGERGVTVAVRFSGWPNVAGFGLWVTPVLVDALLTVCPLVSVPALGSKPVSPPYFAWTACGEPATLRLDVENV